MMDMKMGMGDLSTKLDQMKEAVRNVPGHTTDKTEYRQ
jgi:hypothetical protein